MSECAVAVRDLKFQWTNPSEFCLSLANVRLDQGQSLFVQGASGSGKTTLLNLLGGVLSPSSGEIELLGQSFSHLSATRRDAFRADHIGFIFQQFNLLPYLSVMENVMLPCRFSARRAERSGDPSGCARYLLERLDIAPNLHARPANTLSVGQQQRVAAARALMGKPEIIIADEPTSALDTARQHGFLDLLLGEAKASNAAIIFVSHDKSLSPFFDTHLDIGE